MNPIDAIPTIVARSSVTALMALTERGLCAVCWTDPVVREEMAGFPDGFTFEMKVLPSGPGLRVRKEGGVFLADKGRERPTLSIQFKHLRHALRVIAMVDDVPRAIANDRLIIDGELSWAMRIQRISDRLMSALVPRAFSSAPRAVRLYARIATTGGA